MDGIGSLFFLLWRKKNALHSSPLKETPDFRIPHTVIYEHSYPKGWFYHVGGDETVKRRVGKDIDSSKLLAVLTSSQNVRSGRGDLDDSDGDGERGRPTRRAESVDCDIVASYVDRRVTADGNERYSTEFFDEAALKRFLYRGQAMQGRADGEGRGAAPPSGILQQFVRCRSERNEMISVTWTNNVCHAEKRRTLLPLFYKGPGTRPPLFERASTFDGPERLSELAFAPPHLLERVKIVCNSIAQHVIAHDGRAIGRMTLYMKVDFRDRLYTLWAPELTLVPAPGPVSISAPDSKKPTKNRATTASVLALASQSAPVPKDTKLPTFSLPPSYAALKHTAEKSMTKDVQNALSTQLPVIDSPSITSHVRPRRNREPVTYQPPQNISQRLDSTAQRAALFARQRALLALLVDPNAVFGSASTGVGSLYPSSDPPPFSSERRVLDKADAKHARFIKDAEPELVHTASRSRVKGEPPENTATEALESLPPSASPTPSCAAVNHFEMVDDSRETKASSVPAGEVPNLMLPEEIYALLSRPAPSRIQNDPVSHAAYTARQVLVLNCAEWLDMLSYALFSFFLQTRPPHRLATGPRSIHQSTNSTPLSVPYLIAPPTSLQSMIPYLEKVFEKIPGFHLATSALLPVLAEAHEAHECDGFGDSVNEILVFHNCPQFWFLSSRPDSVLLNVVIERFKQTELVGLLTDFEAQLLEKLGA